MRIGSEKMIRRNTAVVFAIRWVCSLVAAVASLAKGKEKAVGVSGSNSPFDMYDGYGRRTGYAYACQEKLAAYIDWR